MKINYTEIKVTGKYKFELNGEKWTLANYPKNQGTSARGLWFLMTNGKQKVCIYKKDLLKFNKEAAIKLFN